MLTVSSFQVSMIDSKCEQRQKVEAKTIIMEVSMNVKKYRRNWEQSAILIITNSSQLQQ